MGDRQVTSITTRRLEIRPFPWFDVEALTAGQRVPGWAHDYPDEGDLVIARILHGQGRPDGREAPAPSGHHQIVERSSREVIGGIGIFGAPAGGSVEVGYGIVPSRRGRGYASEALVALVAALWGDPDLTAVVAYTELGNRSSQRVLEKAGFRHEVDLGDRRRYRLWRPS